MPDWVTAMTFALWSHAAISLGRDAISDGPFRRPRSPYGLGAKAIARTVVLVTPLLVWDPDWRTLALCVLPLAWWSDSLADRRASR